MSRRHSFHILSRPALTMEMMLHLHSMGLRGCIRTRRSGERCAVCDESDASDEAFALVATS